MGTLNDPCRGNHDGDHDGADLDGPTMTDIVATIRVWRDSRGTYDVVEAFVVALSDKGERVRVNISKPRQNRAAKPCLCSGTVSYPT